MQYTSLRVAASVWKPNEIVSESNGAFDAVRELLVRHAAFGARVGGVSQSRSKWARFSAFSVCVQNGSFLLRDSHRRLYEEMTSFPFGERDDLLDTAATGTIHLLSEPPRLWVMG